MRTDTPSNAANFDWDKPVLSRIPVTDTAVVDWFKRRVHESGGGNYRTLINTALVEHIRAAKEPLEQTIRRVLREKLPSR